MRERTDSQYANREARIRLTPKCSYRRFFCHEEGGCQAPAAEWESLKPLLLALKAQGRREITFTGGELECETAEGPVTLISPTSPLAEAAIGRGVNDTFTVNGRMDYFIRRVA